MLTVCCRICLNQVNCNQMLSLFQTYKGFVIRDALLDLFNIQILPTEMVSTICKECVTKVCTVRDIRDEFITQDKRYREMLRSSPAKDDSDEEKSPQQKPDIRPDPSPTVESTTGEDKPTTVDGTDSTVKHVTESARVTDCDSDSNTLVFYMDQSNDNDDHDAQNSEYELLVVNESPKESTLQREEIDESHEQHLTIGDSDNTDSLYRKTSHEAKHRPDTSAPTETILKELKYEHMYLCEQCETYLETSDAYTSHDCPRKMKTEEETEQNVVFTITTNKQESRSTKKLSSSHCTHCPEAFQTNAQLMRHTKQAHPDRYEVHRCEACSARFASRHALDRHARFRHQGSYQCRFCSKQLLSAYALTSHENTHTKQQTFSCPQCDRMFAQYTSMRRHMALHSDVKAYECEFCQQRFRQRTVMLAHRRRHTGEKPYACDVCDRSFRDHSTLAKHKRLHTRQAKPGQSKVKQESTV